MNAGWNNYTQAQVGTPEQQEAERRANPNLKKVLDQTCYQACITHQLQRRGESTLERLSRCKKTCEKWVPKVTPPTLSQLQQQQMIADEKFNIGGIFKKYQTPILVSGTIIIAGFIGYKIFTREKK